jgi:hypothetical protein
VLVRGVRLQSKEIFAAADDDENGALDLDEVAEMLKNMLGREMDPQEALRVQREMDADGDGLVDFVEFRTWMVGSSGKQLLGQAAVDAANRMGEMNYELPRIMADKEAERLAAAEAKREEGEDPDRLLPPDVERTATRPPRVRAALCYPLQPACLPASQPACAVLARLALSLLWTLDGRDPLLGTSRPNRLHTPALCTAQLRGRPCVERCHYWCECVGAGEILSARACTAPHHTAPGQFRSV